MACKDWLVSSVSFYVSHIPIVCGVEELWGAFSKMGHVKDVFIARRRNHIGVRFGFIRFTGVANAKKLEEELDGMVLRGKRIHVNLPRFQRDSGRVTPGVRTTKRGVNKVISKTSGVRAATEGASYAQVVKGGSSRDMEVAGIGLELEMQLNSKVGKERFIATTGLDWLKKCVVGRLRDPAKVFQLQEVFLLAGLASVRVAYLGDDLVLLSGLEDVDVNDVLAMEDEWWDGLFISIQKWDRSIVPRRRLTWIKCRGMPLFMWSPDSFANILEGTGVVILMAEETASWSNLDEARLLLGLSLNKTLFKS